MADQRNPNDPFDDEPGATRPLQNPGKLGGAIPGLDFSDKPFQDLYVPKAYPPSTPGGDRTVRLGGGAPPAAPQSPAPPGTTPEEGRTVGYFQKPLGSEPVVGWLVCTRGPDRGRDFRIHSGRNFIGRSAGMHIAIQGDAAISREKHAVLIYDPRGNTFKIAPGESAGLVYRNDETVDVPTPLEAFDTLEIGQSHLVFVPFCGPRFQWDSGSH